MVARVLRADCRREGVGVQVQRRPQLVAGGQPEHLPVVQRAVVRGVAVILRRGGCQSKICPAWMHHAARSRRRAAVRCTLVGGCSARRLPRQSRTAAPRFAPRRARRGGAGRGGAGHTAIRETRSVFRAHGKEYFVQVAAQCVAPSARDSESSRSVATNAPAAPGSGCGQHVRRPAAAQRTCIV